LASIRHTTHIIEQAHDLVEHQQHRGEQQRAEQRHGNALRQIAVDEGEPSHFFVVPAP
jgi:hypothetical protein